MPKRLVLSLLLLAMPIQAAASPVPQATIQLSADEERRLQKGEIVVRVEDTGEPIKKTLVTGLIAAPPEVVYPIYSDFGSYTELFKSTRSSEVIKRDGDLLTCKVVIDFPWPLGTRWVTNHTTMDPETTSFTFRKFEGTVRVYEGALKILPEGKSKSRVIYTAKVDPDLPLPAWLINVVQAHYFPMAIQRVRDKVAKSAARKGTDL